MEIFKPTIQDQATFSGSVDISGSLTITQNLNVVGELQGAATTASYISLANVDGFADVSSSIEQRISRQELFSGSLNNTFATDQELSDVSGALAFSIANISSDFADITNKPTLISSSNQLAGETIDGDLTITGTVTAQEFHTEFVSASIIYDSGSTKFGNSADDRHEFTGSVNVSNGITGTLTGNASTATSASYAATGPFLSSYTETDTLASVTGRGASTTTDISIANGQPKLRLKETDSTNVDKELLVSGGDFYIRNLNDNDTAGTNLLLVDSSGNLSATGGGTFTGNVGIGTVSPEQKLHVEGRVVFDSGVSSDIIQFRNDNGGFVIGNTTNLASIDLSSTSNLRIRQGSTIPFYLNSNGNVGIGTTSPNYGKLNVWDTTAGSSINTVADITNGTDVNINIKLTNVGHSSPYAEIASYSTTPLVFQHAQGGNVGIGTTSPGERLDVVSGNIRSYSAANNYGQIQHGSFLAVGDHGGTFMLDLDNNGSADLVNIKKSGASRFYIKNDGNVGIGTTSPKDVLDIKGGGLSGGIAFGTKSMSISGTFADALTVSLGNHTGVYVKITAFGDWSAHSTIAYVGEFFLQNGAGGYMEPGRIIREDSNIYESSQDNDNVVAQIVDPSGNTGDRNFVIQLKASRSSGSTPSGLPFTAYIQYEVRGQYKSIS